MSLIRLANSFFPIHFQGIDDRFFDDFYQHDKSYPAVNVAEDRNNFRMEVELGGLSKEDFKVNVSNGVLTIASNKGQQNESKEENFGEDQFFSASFSRSFTLPSGVDTDKISASYDDGILNIHIPKRDEVKYNEPKEITIA